MLLLYPPWQFTGGTDQNYSMLTAEAQFDNFTLQGNNLAVKASFPGYLQTAQEDHGVDRQSNDNCLAHCGNGQWCTGVTSQAPANERLCEK